MMRWQGLGRVPSSLHACGCAEQPAAAPPLSSPLCPPCTPALTRHTEAPPWAAPIAPPQADALAIGKDSVTLRAENVPEYLIPHKTFSGGWVGGWVGGQHDGRGRAQQRGVAPGTPRPARQLQRWAACGAGAPGRRAAPARLASLPACLCPLLSGHSCVPRPPAGNRPSTSLLLPSLTPFRVGQLLALYENRVATQVGG